MKERIWGPVLGLLREVRVRIRVYFGIGGFWGFWFKVLVLVVFWWF